MWLKKLREMLCVHSSSARRNSAQTRRRQRRVRPGIECLELRIVPTTFNVPAGNTQVLISDISQALTDKQPDTIVLADSFYTLETSILDPLHTGTEGSNGLPAFRSTPGSANSVTIEGNGATIQRDTNSGADFRLLEVASGFHLMLSDVTLSWGLSLGFGGGAVANEGGTVTMTNVLLNNNSAQGRPTQTAYGGAIFSNGGELDLTNVVVAGNKALGGDGTSGLEMPEPASAGNADGGGLYANGSVVNISGSTFSNNVVQGGQGAAGKVGASSVSNGTKVASAGQNGSNGGSGAGGAIFDQASTLTIDNTQITGNSVTGGAGGMGGVGGIGGTQFGYFGQQYPTFIAGAGGNGGGGGNVQGGGLYAVSGTVSLGNSTISSNQLQAGPGGSGGEGGRIFFNTGKSGSGGAGGAGGNAQGGGIFQGGDTLDLEVVTVTMNSATGGAAGVAGGPGLRGDDQSSGASGSIGFAFFGGAAQGGGIYTGGGVLELHGSQVMGNSVLGGAGSAGLNGSNFSSLASSKPSKGGSGAAGGAGGQAVGAGLYLSDAGLTAANSTIQGNSATGGNGGTPGDGGSAANGDVDTTGGRGGIPGRGGDGGVALGGGLAVVDGANAVLNGNVTISQNTLIGGKGGPGGMGGAGGQGGGTSSFRGAASGGAGGYGGNGGNGGSALGGGIYTYSGTVTLTSGAVWGNLVEGGQGGVPGAGGNGGLGGSGGHGGGVATAFLNFFGYSLSLGGGSHGGHGGPGGSGGSGGAGLGGGLYANLGTFTIVSSTLTQNTVVGADGGGNTNGYTTIDGGSGGPGGQNTGFGKGPDGGDGGKGGSGGEAGVGEGGGAFLFQSSGSIVNTTVLENHAVGGHRGLGFHGGIGGQGGAQGTSLVLGFNPGPSGHAGDPGQNGAIGQGQGGGLYVDTSPLTLISDTITQNTATVDVGTDIPTPSGQGGGISDMESSATAVLLANTLVAGNQAVTAPDLSGDFQPLGNNVNPPANLIGIVDGSTWGKMGPGPNSGTLANPLDPRLTVDNTTNPVTVSLQFNSPAINAGDNVLAIDANDNALTTDQRGQPRISGGIVDIGAYEFQFPLAVSAVPASAQAGVVKTITVTATDAHGLTNPDYRGTLHFKSTDSRAVLPADYTFTAADKGRHTFTVTLLTAGTQQLVVISQGIEVGATTITVTPAASASLRVSGFHSTATAGKAQSFTVTAVDAYGNTVGNYTDKVYFKSTDERAKLPPAYTFTAADKGVHTFTATFLTVGGNQSLIATDANSNRVNGRENGINVSPAQAVSLRLSGFSGTTTAGQALSFVLTAYDAYGNVATGYAGSITIKSSDPHAQLPAGYTFTAADDGTHTFSATLVTAGTQSLSASDTSGGSVAGTQSGISVAPARVAKLQLGLPGLTTTGQAQSLTVTALDSYGNVATGYTGTVHFKSSDTRAILPANYTFKAANAGRHTFSATWLIAGSQNVTALGTAGPSVQAAVGNITVSAAQAARLVVSGIPSTAKSGVAYTFTVMAVDAYGNVATGYLDAVLFTSSDPRTQLPAFYFFTAADNGVHTFTATFWTAGGNQSLSVNDAFVSVGGAETGITVN